jgi:Tol biopolymer transport system component/pimeloyl-ACP methyl ester carboxylesterase
VADLNGNGILDIGITPSGSYSPTELVEGAVGPQWSPDGQRLAFVTNPGLHLGVVHPDGSNLTVFQNTVVASVRNYEWIDSSHVIAETQCPGLCLGEIDLASGTMTPVFADPGDRQWDVHGAAIVYTCGLDVCTSQLPFGSPTVIFHDPNGFGMSNESWSPDGTQLAWLGPGCNTISVANAGGSNIRTISSVHASSVSCFERPTWSRDGTKIATPFFGCGGCPGIVQINAVANLPALGGIEISPATFDPRQVWSADSAQLIGEQGSQMATFDASTGQLVTTLGLGNTAVWQPTGALAPPPTPGGGGLIAFVVGDGNSPGLYVEHPDGTSRQLVVGGDMRDPRWSPDGTKIAYVDGADSMLKVVQLSDHIVRSLVCASVSSGPVYGGFGSNLHNWSPDSTKLAINSCHNGLVVVNASTGIITTIDPGGADPSWNPLEDKLLFICGSALCVTDSTGANRTVIPVPAFGIQGTASYSPDGTRIIVPLLVNLGALDLAVMDANGANFRVITTDFQYSNYLYSIPAWAPTDSHRIAYAVNGGSTQLLDVDTLVKSSFPAGVSHQPWSPDGSKLVAESGGDLYLLDAVSGATSRIGQTPETEYQAAWGPATTTPSPAVDLAHSTISVSPSSLPAECPSSSATVTVSLVDTNGQPYTQQTQVAISSSRGATDTIGGSPTTISSGTATFSICSDTPGAAALTATAGGQALTIPTQVTFTPICPHPRLIKTSQVTGDPSKRWSSIGLYRDYCLTAPLLVNPQSYPTKIDGAKLPLTVAAFGDSQPPVTDFLLWVGSTKGIVNPLSNVPVLLVHGWCEDTEQLWANMADSLISQGYRVFSVSFSFPCGSIEPKAGALADAIDAVKALTGVARVDVITHSMGGLTTRYYMEGLGGSTYPYHDDIRNLGMIATPNGGVDQPFRHPQLEGILTVLLGAVLPSPWANDGSLNGTPWYSAASGKYDGLLEMASVQSERIKVTRSENADWIGAAYNGTPSSVTNGSGQTFYAFPQGIRTAISLGGDFIARLNSVPMPADSNYLIVAGTNNCFQYLLIFCAQTMEKPSDGVVFVSSAFDVRVPNPVCFKRNENHSTIVNASSVITKVADFFRSHNSVPVGNQRYTTC